jgi:thiol-disulfide isomerase/thioredoxin
MYAVGMYRRVFSVTALAVLPALLLAQNPKKYVASAHVVSQVRRAAWANDLPAAERALADYRAQHPELTPDLVEAISWAARGASFVKNWEKAELYAKQAFDGSQKLLENRKLDDDKSVPIALGAAIEVLAAVQDARGDRAGALEFLNEQYQRYKGTSIETRIQKNILLLSLEGKPAPAIAMERWIGEKPKTLAELKGKVVLLFFWAHWCGDCKAEMPVLARIQQDFGGKGLTIVGPTQLYGYIDHGKDATPDQEMEYLQNEYQKQHPIPAWMRVPVSQENFLKFGVSTTPTLMLVDRRGIVRLYHPGNLSYEELAAKITPLLEPRT